jgi:8-oxo-dGTP pyrophosphatase MutT (NUDIX family)
MRNPWRTLASRVVYENPWIRVREDRVIRPDGNEGIYGVVMPHSVAVKMVALYDDQRVHLVGQYRYPTNSFSWEIPGGATKPGESTTDAARRELREEAGLGAHRLEQLGGRVTTNNSILSEIGYVYLARDLYDCGGPTPDADEAFEQRTVSLDEALGMVDSGEIEDVLSLVALMRMARLMDQGKL